MPQQSLLTHIALTVNLREGPEGIRGVLRAVASAEAPPTTMDVAREVRLPLPIVAAIRREMEKADLLRRHPTGMALSPRGRNFVQDELGLVDRPLLPRETPTPAKSTSDIDGLAAAFEPYTERRPSADVKLDQSKATIATVARRADLMWARGAVEGRRILILGDDDFVSVGLNLLRRQLTADGKPSSWRELTVLEIDPRITGTLTEIAESESDFDLSVVHHDLADALPPSLIGRYDTVVTDPPYTMAGIDLFCSRAAQALTAISGQSLFLSYAHKDPDHMREVQEHLMRMGYVIAECMPGFNDYEGAAVLANSGQMIVLRTTSLRREIVEGRFSGLLYTGDVKPTRREYVCQECGERHLVGKEETWQTISALKEAGCPSCSETRFALTSRSDTRTGKSS
ncbi:MAG: bis-aminopropyl spermidine synthase family protein [Candidatus Latescibacteria bacterium]|nr:bis-aminopropyl spermidine synthase family protein [Candidatus Latescibacterota bacterium]